MFYFVRSAALFAAVAIVGTTSPSGAVSLSRCNIGEAKTLRAIGSRHRAHERYAEAASWFLAAQRSTRGCRTPDGSMLSAQSLVEAGTLLAKNGDYANALSVLHAAQSELNAIAKRDGRAAASVQPALEIVASVISAINTIAQASM